MSILAILFGTKFQLYTRYVNRDVYPFYVFNLDLKIRLQKKKKLRCLHSHKQIKYPSTDRRTDTRRDL